MAKIKVEHESEFHAILILSDDPFIVDGKGKVFNHSVEFTRSNGEVTTFPATSRVVDDVTHISVTAPDGSMFLKGIVDKEGHSGFDVAKAIEALFLDLLIDFQP